MGVVIDEIHEKRVYQFYQKIEIVSRKKDKSYLD